MNGTSSAAISTRMADEAAWTLIDAAWSSVALMAIAPLQDLLNLDTSARMNLPGRAAGNWTWRLPADAITTPLIDRLLEATTIYGRDPQLYIDRDNEERARLAQEEVSMGSPIE